MLCDDGWLLESRMYNWMAKKHRVILESALVIENAYMVQAPPCGGNSHQPRQRVLVMPKNERDLFEKGIDYPATHY